jgi:hypothetical protein
MNRKRLLSSAVGALIVAAIAGGVAYATIPGPDNVYSACMLKSIGTIRLIDKSLPSTNLMSHCTDKETEISWNQAGQPGPPGPQGAKGEPGAPGTNGTNGTNGADGKDGVSVTSASEPAGANCAEGGVQLTASNGIDHVCNGKDGANGKDGTNGTNGTNGTDGISVTSAVEPVGTNCVNGGSKFTAINGVTYACNGAPGSGGGPTGQDATSVYGTNSISMSATTGATLVPGLSQTISVPSNSVVYVATEGGLITDSSSTTGFSAVDVFVIIDQAVGQGLHRRIVCPNTAGVVHVICGWSLSAAVPLSQGNHTITVGAIGAGNVGAGNAFPGAGTATVSGDRNSVNQGALTVMVLKK